MKRTNFDRRRISGGRRSPADCLYDKCNYILQVYEQQSVSNCWARGYSQPTENPGIYSERWLECPTTIENYRRPVLTFLGRESTILRAKYSDQLSQKDEIDREERGWRDNGST